MAARKKVEEELSREAIIKEATKQFLLHDFEQVSMRALARQLGCSHGAIYYHYSNKSELFAAVVAQYFAELDNIIEQVLTLQLTNEERIHYLFMSFLRFGLNHQNQYRYMFIHKTEGMLASDASSGSYEKFAQVLNQLSTSPLNIFSSFASFLGLHGFVTHFIGRVSSFDEVYEAANQYANYLKNALVNS